MGEAKRKARLPVRPMSDLDNQPWVATACFCRELRVEADGLPSVVGLIPTFTMPPDVSAFKLEILWLNVLYAGTFNGMCRIQTTFTGPMNAEVSPALIQSAPFGMQHRVQVISKMIQLDVTGPGVYWANVSLDSNLATRCPLIVMRAAALPN